MNSVRANGEIINEPKFTENSEKHRLECNFVMAAPFSHYAKNLSPKYRAYLRIKLIGKNAEWGRDTLYEGAHLEVRHGFIQTYVGKNGMTGYNVYGHEIDRKRSILIPDDYEPQNMARLSGKFFNQFYSYDTAKHGRKVGFSMQASPDTKFYGTKYTSFLSIISYGELADKVDEKFKKNQTIDLVEGVMQPFKPPQSSVWGIYINATRIEF